LGVRWRGCCAGAGWGASAPAATPCSGPCPSALSLPPRGTPSPSPHPVTLTPHARTRTDASLPSALPHIRAPPPPPFCLVAPRPPPPPPPFSPGSPVHGELTPRCVGCGPYRRRHHSGLAQHAGGEHVGPAGGAPGAAGQDLHARAAQHTLCAPESPEGAEGVEAGVRQGLQQSRQVEEPADGANQQPPRLLPPLLPLRAFRRACARAHRAER
jgi:hypothetical protein